MNSIYNVLICCFVLITSQTSSALADVGRKTPSLDGTISAGPYYNPATKSYFELFRMQAAPGKKYKWKLANKLAMQKNYKNAKGHLATVKDLATHQFIIKNFSARNFWIGLMYFCNSKSLKWVDGTDASQSKFSAWDTQWSNSEVRCVGGKHMSVHYTTDTSTKALRWRASGPDKFYKYYLVEYPTGKE